MRSLMQEQAEDVAVRIYVEAAQGNQVRYGMGFDNEVAEDDQVIDLDGLRFIVDAESAPYAEGSEIDFIEGLMGRGFTISNPSYVQAGGCGCGSGGSCGCGHAH